MEDHKTGTAGTKGADGAVDASTIWSRSIKILHFNVFGVLR